MRVLVVDDEPGVAEAIGALLEDQGIQCTAALNGADALQAAREASYDAVVTDYAMPQMNGLELAQQLRHTYPQLPIILLTAYGDTFFQQQERELDIDAVVQKPVTVAQLAAVVRRVVGQCRGRDG